MLKPTEEELQPKIKNSAQLEMSDEVPDNWQMFKNIFICTSSESCTFYSRPTLYIVYSRLLSIVYNMYYKVLKYMQSSILFFKYTNWTAPRFITLQYYQTVIWKSKKQMNDFGYDQKWWCKICKTIGFKYKQSISKKYIYIYIQSMKD